MALDSPYPRGRSIDHPIVEPKAAPRPAPQPSAAQGAAVRARIAAAAEMARLARLEDSQPDDGTDDRSAPPIQMALPSDEMRRKFATAGLREGAATIVLSRSGHHNPWRQTGNPAHLAELLSDPEQATKIVAGIGSILEQFDSRGRGHEAKQIREAIRTLDGDPAFEALTSQQFPTPERSTSVADTGIGPA